MSGGVKSGSKYHYPMDSCSLVTYPMDKYPPRTRPHIRAGIRYAGTHIFF